MASRSGALIRVALLDKHAVVRHGLEAALRIEPDFLVVGAYERGNDAIKGLVNSPADLLIMDFSLDAAELDGVSLIRVLRIKYPLCRILILSADDSTATVALALRGGAAGFVGKNEPVSEFAAAVRTVASGAIRLTTDVSYRIGMTGATGLSQDLSRHMSGQNQLSAREQEVMRCYLAGMTVSEIARKFKRSIKTISTQKAAAFRKLGVSSNNELFKVHSRIEPFR